MREWSRRCRTEAKGETRCIIGEKRRGRLWKRKSPIDIIKVGPVLRDENSQVKSVTQNTERGKNSQKTERWGVGDPTEGEAPRPVEAKSTESLHATGVLKNLKRLLFEEMDKK